MNKIEKFSTNLDIKVVYKNKSFPMKALSKILFFNKRFMTSYYTTIRKTIYVPDDLFNESTEEKKLELFTHEAMHMHQAQKFGMLLYTFLYLFPLSLAPISLLSVFFAFILPWYLAMIPLVFLVCLLPLPAPWRKRFEVEGYTAGLYAFHWISTRVKKEGLNIVAQNMFSKANAIEENFTGPNYYWMWPFGVKKELYNNVQKICDGVISNTSEFYKKVDQTLGRIYDQDI